MRGPAPRSVLLALLALLPGLAAAEPADPSGQVTFAGVVDDAGRSALDLSAEIHLDDLRLSGFAARGGLETAPTTLGYGELSWGDLRLGGGRIDDDWGIHLGYAPRFRWRPHRRFELRTRVDVAIGGGALGGARRLDPDGALPRALDLYAGSLGLGLEAAIRPAGPLLLRLGATGDLLAVGAPPRADQGPVADLLGSVARQTDLGLTSALSEAAAGAYGQADLRLLRSGASALTLTYREAWDWIQLDPLQAVLQATGEDVIRLAPIPLRATRSLALRWRHQFVSGLRLRGGVEGRHVEDSTTALDFADRNGWSVGAWLDAEAGPLRGSVAARYHFQAADLEPFTGAWPRYQVSGQLSARVLGDGRAGLRIETGGQLTLTDALGLPREGYAVFGQVRVWFGGEGTPRAPIEDGALPFLLRREAVELAQRVSAGADPTAPADLSLPKSRAEAAALAAQPQVRSTLDAFLADIPASERAAIVSDGKALLAGGGATRETAARLLDRQPRLADRIERFFPGLLQATGLGHASSARAGALVTGYGRGGLAVGAVRRVSRHAITERVDPIAADFAVTTRTPGPTKPGAPTLPSPFAASSLWAFARPGRVDAFTLLVPDGDRYRVLSQVRGRWARFMQRALTGRGRYTR